jgi:hypothetical protein
VPHDVGVAVVATIAATSSRTSAPTTTTSPVVGHAPPPLASAFAQRWLNLASHFEVSGTRPALIARAVVRSKQKL